MVYKKIKNVRLHIDVTFPKDRGPYPCAVFFHGGGWTQGQKEDIKRFPWIIEPLLNANIAVASVQYRLVGKNGGEFPAGVEDCIHALTYLDTLPQIKKDKKAVWGISSGAYMALMSVLYQPVCNLHTPVSAILALCAPTDLLSLAPKTQPLARAFLANTHSEFFNPINLLAQAQQKPPMMIVHGSADEYVPVDQSRSLYMQAMRSGFYAQYLEAENAGHTFQSVGGRIYPPMQELFKQMSQFLIQNI